MGSKAYSDSTKAPGVDGRTVSGVEAGAGGRRRRGEGQHAAGGPSVNQEILASDGVEKQDERTARRGSEEAAPAVNSVGRPGAGSMAAASGGAESTVKKTETAAVDRW